jgi:hypothetical protein
MRHQFRVSGLGGGTKRRVRRRLPLLYLALRKRERFLRSPLTSLSTHEQNAPAQLQTFRAQMASTKVELDGYFEMIDRRLPNNVARCIRWLRQPSSFWIRLLVALLLIVGGFFSFLPVLGLWMLPLGLLLIAQDVPILQKPLTRAFRWMEAKWQRLRVTWGKGIGRHNGEG